MEEKQNVSKDPSVYSKASVFESGPRGGICGGILHIYTYICEYMLPAPSGIFSWNGCEMNTSRILPLFFL